VAAQYAVGTYEELGTCDDIPMQLSEEPNLEYPNLVADNATTSNTTWESFNQRTSTGKTCAMYQSQQLCKLCERVFAENRPRIDQEYSEMGFYEPGIYL
jgi:hypothetical protein